MNEIKYLGEHLWVGEIGHIFIILSFVAALLSSWAYFISANYKIADESSKWSLLGRSAFYVHGITLFGLIGLIFFAMYNHMYEYSYVFDHVSEELPLKYILSAFWEGQEGSFMLWMFWHTILGFILIKTTGQREPYILFTIAVAEAILMSMLLGIHIPWGDDAIRIGSNPTTLLRQMNEAPIFNNADYLSLIKGRGMNPLLQNYWMTIHPPTLFLGFASTIVPFAFAFAGLWQNDHKEWLKVSLPWSLFSAGILGTGILMGSLWAYVALSFGGYWAWDPVENASLVPWITLVAGIHVHLVSKSTGYATRSVYFFYLISFILILYSTFLTRSGVLGDTSAHAFTEMGLEWQLVLLVVFFIIAGFGLLVYRYVKIRNPEKEEELASREFWMFIGSLVLLFSAVLITTSTSLPVFNKIMTHFNPAYEGRVIKDVINHYNKYQLWISVFVAVLSSFSLYLRFGAALWITQRKQIITKWLIFMGISMVLTWLSTFWLNLYSWQFYLLAVTGFFSMVANGDYIISKTKGNIKLAFSAVSHFGFGMMIVGILASGLNQKFISTNPFVFKDMFTDEDLQKYVQLIKGKPLFSQGYLITYESDTLVGRERKYSINFKKLNDSLEVTEEMTLHPNAVYSNDFTKVAAYNPDTKHYFTKDIFTCVVGLPPALESVEKSKEVEDKIKFIPYRTRIMDTLMSGDFIIQPQSVSYMPLHKEYLQHKHDAGVEVTFAVTDIKTDSVYICRAALGVDGALMYNYPATIEEAGIKIKLDESVINDFITPDDQLEYKEFTIKNGGTFDYKGHRITLTGFDKNPEHANYTPQENDIAVAALLKVVSEGKEEDAAPLYIIRQNQPMSIKYYSPASGIHIRFSNIDPAKEEFSFKVAADNRKEDTIKIGVATDVPRNDYLILQATIFPGINLFWLGCILMMAGLFGAGWHRYYKNI